MNSQSRSTLVVPSWRKTSYSTGTGNCVEYAAGMDVVLLRDSKRPDAGLLTLAPDARQGLARALTADARAATHPT